MTCVHLYPGSGGAIAAVTMLLLWYLVFYLTASKDATPTFGDDKIGFRQFLPNYVRAAELVIGLASGSISLIVGSNVIRSAGRLPWFYASPLILLGISIVYALFFIVLLTMFYEDFLYDEESYTLPRYCAIRAFGIAALTCFCGSYLLLAVMVV